MYGDAEVMRRRAADLREQGVDLRALADRLVARTAAVGWTGRAATALDERVRTRAAHLRDLAARHDDAAQALDHHLGEVDHLKEVIAATEHRVRALVAEGRRAPASTPPPGHRDWLTLELPGL
jgi:uncharacterized protein YukE